MSTIYRTCVLSISPDDSHTDRKEQVFDLLNSYSNIIISYHGEEDCKSQWPHRHWHVIYEPPNAPRWDNDRTMQQISALCQMNGYYSSQKVRMIDRMVLYIQTPPRQVLTKKGELQQMLDALTTEQKDRAETRLRYEALKLQIRCERNTAKLALIEWRGKYLRKIGADQIQQLEKLRQLEANYKDDRRELQQWDK